MTAKLLVQPSRVLPWTAALGCATALACACSDPADTSPNSTQTPTDTTPAASSGAPGVPTPSPTDTPVPDPMMEAPMPTVPAVQTNDPVADTMGGTGGLPSTAGAGGMPAPETMGGASGLPGTAGAGGMPSDNGGEGGAGEPGTPPEGAIQLLSNGGDLSAWKRWQAQGPAGWDLQDGVMTIKTGAGAISTTQEFGDARIYLEFRTPERPPGETDRFWGNSGIYVQGRYELQISENFEYPPNIQECGAIYQVKAPDTNECAPGGEWQSYDIEFTAAVYNGAQKQSNARITVIHNGVMIHNDVEIPKGTQAGAAEAPGPGPIMLQDHSHPTSYRNIWILPQ